MKGKNKPKNQPDLNLEVDLDPSDDAPEPPYDPGSEDDDEIQAAVDHGHMIDPTFGPVELRTRQEILTEFDIAQEFTNDNDVIDGYLRDSATDISRTMSPKEITPKIARVPGSCMLSSFVPLQLPLGCTVTKGYRWD